MSFHETQNRNEKGGAGLGENRNITCAMIYQGGVSSHIKEVWKEAVPCWSSGSRDKQEATLHLSLPFLVSSFHCSRRSGPE